MGLSIVTNFSQKGNQNQSQVMAQGMQQALYVLQLPLVELADYVTQEVSDNCMLEFADRSTPSSGSEEADKVREYHESLIVEERSLFTHLMAQAREVFSTTFELHIAEEIIGNLDERGFYPDIPKCKAVLHSIQSFDPPGIGAKNLQECLLIQLPSPSLSHTLVEHHFDLFLDNKKSLLQKLLNCSHLDLQNALDNISKLNFNPASHFAYSFNPSIVVDLILDHDGEKWSIDINDSFLPPFKLKTEEKDPTLARHYRTQAKWLITALRKRESTLKRIAKELIKHNEAFLLGDSSLTASLTMQEMAASLNLHESTITRAVSDKYLRAPAGLFPLRTFFKKSGNTASVLLKQLISRENKARPLSDDALAQKLRSQGVSIARRTVTKYRKELKIASASKRKQS